jgi:tRNA pseudouridine synthase A
MINIKLIYQYDGSCFYGSQRQKDKKTVQGTIENILLTVFNEKINLISSGRTDRGVHAKKQISNFIVNNDDINLESIKYVINKYSFGEIKVLKVENVNLEYNSRYDNNVRTYEYIFTKGINITPFNSKYISQFDEDIDIDKLNSILKQFIGNHNFSSFSRKDNKSNKNPMREIYECYAKRINENIHIYIKGSSFLKTMVRIMVGTTFEIYKGKLDVSYIKKNFSNPNSDTKKYIAQENGLYLYNVE